MIIPLILYSLLTLIILIVISILLTWFLYLTDYPLNQIKYRTVEYFKSLLRKK